MPTVVTRVLLIYFSIIIYGSVLLYRFSTLPTGVTITNTEANISATVLIGLFLYYIYLYLIGHTGAPVRYFALLIFKRSLYRDFKKCKTFNAKKAYVLMIYGVNVLLESIHKTKL